jgi:hypothetical protein
MTTVPNVKPNVLNNVLANVNPGVFQAYGPELVVDGNMEAAGAELFVDGSMEAAGVSDWTAGNNASLTKESGSYNGSGSQVLQVAYGGPSNYPYAYQSILTASTDYIFLGYAKGNGTKRPVIRSDSAVLWTGTVADSWQPSKFRFSATSAVIGGGGELLVSGDSVQFDSFSVKAEDITAWTAVASATLTKEVGTIGGGDLVLRVAYNGVVNPGASQSNIMDLGKTYLVTGYARGDGASGRPRVLSADASISWLGTTSSSWQPFSVTATTTNRTLVLRNQASSGWAEFDNISIREVL